jgi:hypothetical protein
MNASITALDLALAGLVGSLCTVVAWWLLQRNRSAPRLPESWAISRRPVLGAVEQRLYQHLRMAFPHHLIAPKLALVRLCQPNEASKVRYWYELLGSGLVTFAVCSPDGDVLLAIDLESDRPRSRRSTRIKQSVLEACGIHHLRVTADAFPAMSELRALLPFSSVAGDGRSASRPSPAPQLNAARAQLASTVAARRAQRSPRWQESGLFQASVFSQDALMHPAPEQTAEHAPEESARSAATGATQPESLATDARGQPRTMQA